MIKYSKWAFTILATLFLLCIMTQVLLAGLATFDDSLYWTRHTSFVEYFQFLPIAMLLLSIVGKLNRELSWRSLLLCALVAMMFLTVHIDQDFSCVAGTHPLFALFLFWLSIGTAKRAWLF